jgi:hypothetical protein
LQNHRRTGEVRLAILPYGNVRSDKCPSGLAATLTVGGRRRGRSGGLRRVLGCGGRRPVGEPPEDEPHDGERVDRGPDGRRQDESQPFARRYAAPPEAAGGSYPSGARRHAPAEQQSHRGEEHRGEEAPGPGSARGNVDRADRDRLVRAAADGVGDRAKTLPSGPKSEYGSNPYGDPRRAYSHCASVGKEYLCLPKKSRSCPTHSNGEGLRFRHAERFRSCLLPAWRATSALRRTARLCLSTIPGIRERHCGGVCRARFRRLAQRGESKR